MAYLPTETFKHMFGLMSKIVGGIKKALLATGVNVFIALIAWIFINDLSDFLFQSLDYVMEVDIPAAKYRLKY